MTDTEELDVNVMCIPEYDSQSPGAAVRYKVQCPRY